MFNPEYLSLIYAGLMALAVLVYAILDGYDLGVGMMIPLDDKETADTMIASIGPFWDANETWLVLAVGLAFIAFPQAHSMILQALYIPVVFLLFGLIMRGVAFDFRAKARVKRQRRWDKVFKFGSLLTSFAQGYMLGLYVIGFENTPLAHAFAIFSGIGVVCAYGLIGSAWLIMKCEGKLQQDAISWCKKFARVAFVGVLLVSIINPAINEWIYERWFDLPMALVVLPAPIICLSLFVILELVLQKLPKSPDNGAWLPFLISAFIFVLCFFGLVYSFYPFVVPGKLTIFEAVADASALTFLLYGVVIVVPTLIAYTLFSYRVFWGKVQPLSYY
ncbi:cytochrome BD ubiquinol oxidase subunit II [Pseudoalteromonas sp. A22]|uniref:cytochrome d ubiquinol oxidase subunit II n=1 Tax=Pseudoalteromonas TaxID=53246 RepID=UPI001BAC3107|nr:MULTISPECIES: cytochrome d ubiquinol oxidase subunit II [Pseudoalteromonas]QUI61070.1 cytochrome BD ubiquinol oxidase subunit II [Pseudoalteromonas sp. A22]USE71475.1 cytochrome BD ubiquinol oxidase subunit II [Pseudoalteromonas flavipulchra]